MNKTELIAIAAEKAGMTKKDSERVINAALDAITATLAENGRVQLSGFGIFEVKAREARMGRNPKTNEPMEIASLLGETAAETKIALTKLKESIDNE